MKNGLYADNCTRGSFDRRNFAGSLVQKKLNKHSVWISKAKSFCVYQDFFARRLAENGVLDAHAVKTYEDRMSALLFEGNILEENADEDVLRLIYREREKEFGFEALAGEKNEAASGEKNGKGSSAEVSVVDSETVSAAITGIDDSDALDVLKKRPGVVFCITDRKFRTLFSEAVGEALRDGKQVVVLTPEKDYWLPDAEEICRESGVLPLANEKPSASADSDLLP